MSCRSAVILSGILFAGCSAVPAANGQTSLGGQRVSTSSATFLKIGVDARGTSLGNAYVALADGPLALFYNPARIAQTQHPAAAFGYTRWPADVDLVAVGFVAPVGHSGASVGVSIEYLGTTIEETTEYHPQGTGRTFSYSDAVLGFSAARPLSDRLSVGGTFKLYREDLGSAIGGPVASGWLVDAGTVYEVGTLGARLAIALLHFGPDIEPDGSYSSHLTGGAVQYAAFSAPTTFRLGFSAQPVRRGPHALVASVEVAHQSDNEEAFRTGLEYGYLGRYFARAGYDGSADTQKIGAGVGIRLPFRDSDLRFDYAYADGGALLAIHRWCVVLPL